MFELIISINAEIDLKESCEWYELQQNGLSKRFLGEVFRTMRFIESNPLLYQIRNKRNYRLAKVNTFPFVVAYTIDGKRIFINAIFHTSRNPQKKYRT